jgi:hypothetical protein
MPSDPEHIPEESSEPNEKKLCVSCMFANETDVHFCAKCGAPMTSYAATGPLEHILAEGHVYRQAAERPSSFIVVLGIWIIFSTMALAGAGLLFLGLSMGFHCILAGGFFLIVSLTIIWKTTRSYFTKPQVDDKNDT